MHRPFYCSPFYRVFFVRDSRLLWNENSRRNSFRFYFYHISYLSLAPLIVLQLIFFAFMTDTTFYWSHRLMHSKSLWQYHKVHHSLKVPLGIAAEYAHPVTLYFDSVNSNENGHFILPTIPIFPFATL